MANQDTKNMNKIKTVSMCDGPFLFWARHQFLKFKFNFVFLMLRDDKSEKKQKHIFSIFVSEKKKRPHVYEVGTLFTLHGCLHVGVCTSTDLLLS